MSIFGKYWSKDTTVHGHDEMHNIFIKKNWDNCVIYRYWLFINSLRAPFNSISRSLSSFLPLFLFGA